MKLTSHNLPKSKKKYLELHYGTKKIKNYEEEDFKKLSKFILALCKLSGVTEPPDTDVIYLLVEHIQEHHKDFSKEEIQNAFSLAMAGKLDFNFVHYNRMTPQLVSHTLNSYKKFRSKEILIYESKLRKEERLEIEKANKRTPEQQLASHVNGCLDYYNQYIKKDGNPQDWGSIRYDFLTTVGVINFTIEERQKIKDETQAELISEKRKKGNLIAKEDYQIAMIRKASKDAIEEINNGNSPVLISRAKQKALNIFFDSLIEQKEDFGNILKKALMKGDSVHQKVAKDIL